MYEIDEVVTISFSTCSEGILLFLKKKKRSLHP